MGDILREVEKGAQAIETETVRGTPWGLWSLQTIEGKEVESKFAASTRRCGASIGVRGVRGVDRAPENGSQGNILTDNT
jgi:hypothetical protein